MYVVTTDHAGIPDIVEDGVNGIVATSGMLVDEIYERLLLHTNEQIVRISEQNRKYCKNCFTENSYISSMKNVFDALLS